MAQGVHSLTMTDFPVAYRSLCGCQCIFIWLSQLCNLRPLLLQHQIKNKKK